eukprot:6180029-Pleurochrysis_carterae.AAC.7
MASRYATEHTATEHTARYKLVYAFLPWHISNAVVATRIHIKVHICTYIKYKHGRPCPQKGCLLHIRALTRLLCLAASCYVLSPKSCRSIVYRNFSTSPRAKLTTIFISPTKRGFDQTGA